MHSTNYRNTFIETADDCAADRGIVPPEREEKTVARMQFDMLFPSPYEYTSDEVIFSVHAERKSIPQAVREKAKEDFFSKGQACFRSSPLAKTYGWGFHFNDEEKVAIHAKDSEQYARLCSDPSLKHIRAMKSSR